MWGCFRAQTLLRSDRWVNGWPRLYELAKGTERKFQPHAHLRQRAAPGFHARLGQLCRREWEAAGSRLQHGLGLRPRLRLVLRQALRLVSRGHKLCHLQLLSTVRRTRRGPSGLRPRHAFGCVIIYLQPYLGGRCSCDTCSVQVWHGVRSGRRKEQQA
jgi:hypothetical protein